MIRTARRAAGSRAGSRGAVGTAARRCAAVWLLATAALAAPAGAAILQVPGDYPTIQAAVEAAAAGDEIVIAAGTYEEQVVIERDLTLSGAGIGQTILLAPLNMPVEVGTLRYNPVIYAAAPATSLTIRDLSIEGDGRGRSGTRFVGVMLDQVGGVLQRLDVGGLHETPAGPQLTGIGIYCQSNPGDDLQILMEDLRLDRFQKSGVALFGSGCTYLLRRVTADASELYSPAVHNAFELGNATSGVLEACTARGAWYDGNPITGTTACGFLFYYSEAWTAADLVADGNQTGIYSIASELAISGGSVTSYDQPLNFNYGIVITGPGTLLAAPRLSAPQPVPLEPRAIPLVSPLGLDIGLRECEIRGTKLADSVGLIQFASLDEVRLTMDACAVADWDVGVLAAESGNGSAIGRIRTTTFRGHLGPALVSETARTCDARGNDWGDPSGPYEPDLNPGGLGESVLGNVLFTPWLEGNVVCAPLPLYIGTPDADVDGYSAEVTVRYLGNDIDPVYGFSAELRWSPGKLTADAADVSRPASGPFAAATLFQVLPLADGLRIDAALGGAQPGVPAGDLFTLRFHLVGEPDYTEIPVSLTVRNLRDGSNREIAAYVADDGLVIGDVQPPVITTSEVINSSLNHTDAYAKNGDVLKLRATVSDGDPFFGAQDIVGEQAFLFGAAGYLRPAETYEAGIADWPGLPASLVPADGTVQFSITATDPAGNVATRADSVIADNTPPLAVGGLTAAAGHNSVELGWEEPAGLDANLRHVVIRSAGTGAYPQYGPLPDYPASPTAGDPVYTGLGKAVTVSYDTTGAERDILAFQAFAVDMVGLASDTTAGSRVRQMNYVLGDVAAVSGPGYDGVVDGTDVARLAAGWDVPVGQPGAEPETDLGPVAGRVLTGLPRPDGVIDLDDLMLFAHAYTAGPPGPVPPGGDGDPVPLTWTRPDAQTWVLSLAAPVADFKGLRVTGALPGGAGMTVVPDSLLGVQTAPYFLAAAGTEVDVSLAVLGPGVAIIGSGPLLRITTDVPVETLDPEYDARSTTNATLSVYDPASAAPDRPPAVFALRGNVPNPFNPATRIVFDLPSPQAAVLDIYAVDGSRVASLRTGPLPAGRNALTWRGRDGAGRSVAAGVYLYRLRAGPWAATGKMNLVR